MKTKKLVMAWLEALDELGRVSCEMVLMDVQMLERNGVEAAVAPVRIDELARVCERWLA